MGSVDTRKDGLHAEAVAPLASLACYAGRAAVSGAPWTKTVKSVGSCFISKLARSLFEGASCVCTPLLKTWWCEGALCTARCWQLIRREQWLAAP